MQSREERKKRRKQHRNNKKLLKKELPEYFRQLRLDLSRMAS